ncbi:MAG TPA: ATP-dependent Clp protease ATP-binding subunit [Spirochaetota bacterium]|nr:ATP-dependent Clp protease ATP-binding subunit [Spirochaetota bacterium]
MKKISEIRKKAEEIFKNDSYINIAQLLAVWTMEPEDKDIVFLFNNSGLEISKIVPAMRPLFTIKDDSMKDLLVKVISESTENPPNMISILEFLCNHTQNQVTESLIQSGMDCHAVLQNIQSYKNGQGAFVDLGIKTTNTKESVLLKYGRNLINPAKDGAFDYLYTRKNELDSVVNILLKMNKGNPILTGAAGVGKTACVEILAREIATGAIKELKDYNVIEISMAKIVAGTRYRGEFEERMVSIIDSAYEFKPLIIFIDEIHLLVGAGRAEGAPMDGANILKPYLSRNDIKIIGATTEEEYRKYFRGDEALSRRFQEVKLKEPDAAMLLKILEKQTEGLIKHHNIKIETAIIQKAITLTDKHLPNKKQPDNTIDLLDCAAVNAKRAGKEFIDETLLLETIASLSNIDEVKGLSKKSKDILLGLEDTLKTKIIGQNSAIKQICSSLIYRKYNPREDKPVAVYLFAGDTGIGKTELAKQLTKQLFNSDKSLIRIDCAEFSTPGSISRLIGSAPGFIRSDEDGVLVKALSNNPVGIILFDEIEKADRELIMFLLGIMDTGFFTSNRGDKIDARHTIIIMTTNAVTSKDLEKRRIGFGNDDNIDAGREKFDIFKDFFPPEFLGRIDEIIPFRSLDVNDIKEIFSLRFNEVVKNLCSRKIII